MMIRTSYIHAYELKQTLDELFIVLVGLFQKSSYWVPTSNSRRLVEKMMYATNPFLLLTQNARVLAHLLLTFLKTDLTRLHYMTCNYNLQIPNYS